MTKKLTREHPTTVVRLNNFNGIRARSPMRYSQQINAGKATATYNCSSTSTAMDNRPGEKDSHHVKARDNGVVVPGILIPAPLKSQQEGDNHSQAEPGADPINARPLLECGFALMLNGFCWRASI
jgi:hypothetical protein